MKNAPTGAAGIVYNVTVKVEPAIAAAWEQWLIQEHAPQMLATNCFVNYTLVKLLDMDDSDGPTYAVQYGATDLQQYQHYMKHFAAPLQKAAIDKWGQQFVSFSTLMEVIQ